MAFFFILFLVIFYTYQIICELLESLVVVRLAMESPLP